MEENNYLERKIAIDGINGITYIGKSANTLSNSLLKCLPFGEFIFGRDLCEMIKDYCITQTSNLISSHDKSYFEKANELYNSSKLVNKTTGIPSNKVQAIHSLDDFEK
jgi:hypothetical protein